VTDRYLTTAEAAEQFWLPRRTVETWTARGVLAPVAPGLYREADVADAELRTRRRPRLDRLVELAAGVTGMGED